MNDLTFRQSQQLVDQWVREQRTDYCHPLAQLASRLAIDLLHDVRYS